MKYSKVLSLAAVLAATASPAIAQRGRDDRGRDDHPTQQQQPDHHDVSPQEQQRRIAEERQRQADYQKTLNMQIRAAQAHSAELQTAQRNAQYAQHQQYIQSLQQQQQRLQAERDYAHDPYITTPPSFRYRFNGTMRETNQYGADMLKQAVDVGYQQGYQSGLADRRDHARSNYQGTFGYRDANYGYTGSYVPRSDYNYYFRQGFQRGYQDGFNARAQYGTVNNGTASILGNIVSGILGLTSIR